MDNPGMLWYVRMYARSHIQMLPSMLVIFGDNLEGTGRGGQACACRDEPNCYGIPTKRYPAETEESYFNDNDYAKIKKVYDACFGWVKAELLRGRHVVMPYYGLGTGRAQLEHRAPRIHAELLEQEKALKGLAYLIKDANNLLDVAKYMGGLNGLRH